MSVFALLKVKSDYIMCSSLGITVGYGNIIDQRKPGKATVSRFLLHSKQNDIHIF